MASYLGVNGRYGIAHILSRPDTIDRHLIESTAATYRRASTCCSVRPPPRPIGASAMNYDNLLRTLDACRESYDYIVVDAPRRRMRS